MSPLVEDAASGDSREVESDVDRLAVIGVVSPEDAESEASMLVLVAKKLEALETEAEADMLTEASVVAEMLEPKLELVGLTKDAKRLGSLEAVVSEAVRVVDDSTRPGLLEAEAELLVEVTELLEAETEADVLVDVAKFAEADVEVDVLVYVMLVIDGMIVETNTEEVIVPARELVKYEVTVVV